MNARALPALLLVLLFALPVGAGPTKLAQQDRVLDADGSPIEGSRGVVVAPCDAGTEGVELRTEERD